VKSTLALIVAFATFVMDAHFRSLFPEPFGGVPLVVPWSGAVGAVVVGLFGIFFHSDRWNNSYSYWYLARPLTGALLGSFAYVIFVGIIMATGTRPNTSNPYFYAALAFLVGFRERTFFDLITQVTGVVLGPGKTQPDSKEKNSGG